MDNELNKEISCSLFLALIASGFTAHPLSAADRHDRGIQRSFPFGRFRRTRGEGNDQIEIQIEAKDTRAFRLNIGFVPREGIKHSTGFVREEDVWNQYLPRYAQMYDSPLGRRWFSASGSLFRRPAKGVQEVVENVVQLLPEVELALAEFDHPNSSMKHIRWVSAE